MRRGSWCVVWSAATLLLVLAQPAWAGSTADGEPRTARTAGRGKAKVPVPAGRFQMGSGEGEGNPDERPLHRPRISRYAIDRAEVTNGAYLRCVKAGACGEPSKRGSKLREHYFGNPEYSGHPVVNVSWYQAQTFCNWRGGRLPTEAEWEKAARGPKDRRKYPWGDRKPDCSLANFGGPDGCSGDTDRTGIRPAGKSPYGALDMAGNVWEWTGDWYDPRYYRRSPKADPRGPKWGSFKVMRGGCYDTAPEGLRVSCRNQDFPTSQKPNVGFRCAYPVKVKSNSLK